MNIIQDIEAAIGGGTTAPAPQAPAVVLPDRFPACVAVTLGYEGGFADNPEDPGGATNFGITANTLAAFLGRPVTTDEVRGMAASVAQAIYRAKYWDLMRCGELPAGVDLTVFDFGVNSGTGEAARVLQGLVGARPDGQIGPATIAAVGQHDAGALIDALAASRLAFLRHLPTFGEFGDGWTRRVTGVQADAHRMAA